LTDLVEALTDQFILRGQHDFIRSDNGAEFIAKRVRAWIGAVSAETAVTETGLLCENGY
jgi:putative transposase